MVLAELGGRLRESLRKLGASGSNTVTTADLHTLLADISRALIEADVNVQLVRQVRDNIQNKVEHLLSSSDEIHDDTTTAATANKPPSSASRTHANLYKIVQRAVVDELTALLQPNKASAEGGGGGGGRSKASSKKGGGSSAINAAGGGAYYQMRRGKPNVVLFVGLQGAGKTTTIAKFANYYQRRGWKTAMVCADTFRAGAFDQLKQNATKLRVPFYGSYTEADPVTIAEQGVEQFIKDRYELIIVDTSGRHKQEAALFEEMQEIAASVNPDNTVLVIDATQGQAVYDQAKAFHEAVAVGSVIVTKLDGHAKGGGALSAVAATNSPVIFTGSGEHFDDLDPFDAQSFISKLMGFGDLRGLMAAMKGDDGGKQQEELMEKMSKGEFTLRDMYNQFEKILNMGPLSKLAGMIPGMPEYLVPQGGDQESTNRLRKFMVMMDSMNNAELDGKVDLNKKDDPNIESRIRRIAAGSGSHPNEVKMLLLAHRQFEGMVSKMGKSGLMGKGAQAKQAQMISAMRKNPNLINQRLNQMDPRMLQQMGGRENVMQMMQQMAKGGGGGGGGGGPGGMPDMNALSAMMSGLGGGGGGGMPPGMPNFGGGGGGGMPGGIPPGMDMQQMMQMAQAMGMGGIPPGTDSGRR